MRLVLVVLASLTIVSLAGCFGAQPPLDAPADTAPEAAPVVPPTPPEFDWASAIHVTHPEGVAGHGVPGTHGEAVGMELVGFSDISAGMRYQAMTSGQYNEVDICGDMAVVGSFAGNRGFTLVNVTNGSEVRAHQQFASSALTWDVRFSPDCQLVFMGMENLDALPPGTATAPSLPLSGVHDTGRGGVVMVDVSDPTYPERLAYLDMGTVHNLFSFAVDDETFVVVNTGGIWKVTGDGTGRTLEKVSEVPRSHDVHVQRHPVTGTPYLFTGENGLAIYDVSVPAAPELVAHLEFPAGQTMGHEQTPAPAMIDGRWLIVGAGENIGGMPEPFTIADITDPSEPAVLGTWTLPGDFSAHDTQTAFFTFSPHNVAIRPDGRVALANYHAGTWIIDISTKERQEDPVTLGFALPDPPQAALPEAVGADDPAAFLQAWASPYAIVRSLPYTPFVWGGAWTDDGELVVADLNSGVYVYRVP